jgi:hypothetical protein
MTEDLLKIVKIKSPSEILLRLKELVHRHRRRYLRRYLRPLPDNCKYSDVVGRRVVGCSVCNHNDLTTCKYPQKFKPVYSKDQLCKQFAEDIRNPQILLRDYRDLVVFFWIIGAFDKDNNLNEQVLNRVESK